MSLRKKLLVRQAGTGIYSLLHPRRHGIFIFIVWDLRRGKGWALFSVTSGPLSQSQIIFHFGVGDWDWKGKQEGPLERELRDDLSTPRDQGKISLERWELTVKSLRETLVTPLLRLETTSRWEQRCGQDVFLSSSLRIPSSITILFDFGILRWRYTIIILRLPGVEWKKKTQ